MKMGKLVREEDHEDYFLYITRYPDGLCPDDRQKLIYLGWVFSEVDARRLYVYAYRYKKVQGRVEDERWAGMVKS
jgi:hypothetical protein